MEEPLTIPSIALSDAVAHYLNVTVVHQRTCGGFCEHMVSALAEVSKVVMLEFCEMDGWKQLIDALYPSTHETSKVGKLRALPYPEYLQTEHWLNLREKKIREAGNRCQLCNSEGILNVHHRTYERRGYEYDTDLIVLCADCHQHFHGIQPTP